MLRHRRSGESSATGNCPGNSPKTIVAKREQQFNLYKVGQKVPLQCEIVLAGQRVGLSRDGGGRLLAIAGPAVFALEEGKYQWKHVPSEVDGVPRILVTVAIAATMVARAVPFLADSNFRNAALNYLFDGSD